MTDLSLVTAGKMEIVESYLQFTLPLAEACGPGKAARLDTSSGKLTKSNASSAAEARILVVMASNDNAAAVGTGVRKGVLDGFDLSGMNYDADVYLSSTDGALCDADPGVNEKVTVTLDAGAGAGDTFTLTFGAQTTAAIAYNATAAEVESAIELLSTVGQGNVQVTGSAIGPYTLEFVGALAKTNVGAVTAGATGMSAPTIAVAQAGVASVCVGRVIPGTAVNLGTAYDKLFLVDL